MNTKIALKYGAISGLIIVLSWFITIGGGDIDFSGGEIVGYSIMIVALTAVFLGIKSKRDGMEKGAFTFKDGFLTGLGIVIVASVIYVIGWMIYMPNFAPDFAEKYTTAQIEMIQNSNVSDGEKQDQINQLNESMKSYKKPHIMAAFTFIEIFPVGLIVTLISALILKRKE